MVVSEKSSNSLKNGQRSRGPSPNSNGGASSPVSPIDDEGEKIRVGRDYQAVCPDMVPVERKSPEEVPDRALLVWSPSKEITDDDLDKYIQTAKEKFGYNGEQALGMLFWHKHDLTKAVSDLGNFTPFPEEFSPEDKVLFEQAFAFHGKTFHRIKQMLPDKSMASLVKYYYTWKKTRTRTSLMDRQARKSAGAKEETSEHGSEQGSNNSDSETDENKLSKENGEQRDQKEVCHNCGIPCTLTKSTPKGSVCNTCYIHWRKTGNMRPTIGPLRGRDRHCYNWLKNKWRPPKGMHIDHEDLVSLSNETASGPSVTLDREIASLKRQVQSNKQAVSSLKKKNSENMDEFRPADGVGKANARWSNEEQTLAIQGVRKYGKNFKAIADLIGTKTEAHVRTFFASHRKRHNLDTILREYENDQGGDKDKEKMDVDCEIVNETSTPSN